MKRTIGASAWVGLGVGGAYSYNESGDLLPHELSVTIRDLPPGFEGVRIAFMTDLHRGVFISQEYVQKAVALALALKPDLIFLGGDYVDHDPELIVNLFRPGQRLEGFLTERNGRDPARLVGIQFVRRKQSPGQGLDEVMKVHPAAAQRQHPEHHLV